MTHFSRLAMAGAFAAFGAWCSSPALAQNAQFGDWAASAPPSDSAHAAGAESPGWKQTNTAHAGKGYLVEKVQIDQGQKMRLNVVLLEPGPRHSRVMLSILNAKGEQVRQRGPVDLDRGSATHIQMQGPGHYGAYLRVADKRCQSAVQGAVEVF
jgi:hypothetical protein